MLPFDPNSTSELLRASHIVLVTIDSADFGEWVPAGEMVVCREVRSRVRIERTLKGDLEPLPGGTLSLTFDVCENRGPRFVAVPRIWSGHEIKPGERYLVFSAAGSKDPAFVLTEPQAFRVEDENALAEIEAVLRTATPEKRLPALVSELSVRRQSFSHLFARYVAWRLRELLYNNPAGFSAILDEAENPDTSGIFRRIVITEAYDDLMMLDPAPPVFIARLIWGSVRAIASGTAADLSSRILQTYIPNLLGMDGGLPRKSADMIFQSAPKPREEVEAILEARPDLPGRDTLLTWLDS